MDNYVYIIKSEKSGIFYKGYTTDPKLRLLQHNSNQSRFTARKGPWKLDYLEKLKDKSSALIKEKQLKRANINSLNGYCFKI
ncbi:MAG: GIY-YIG nuclease family protein [Bacteroidales bacterium]|nr:GIY-YIG nuclease family protein [Bacteroidales bacterium]